MKYKNFHMNSKIYYIILVLINFYMFPATPDINKFSQFHKRLT